MINLLSLRTLAITQSLSKSVSPCRIIVIKEKIYHRSKIPYQLPKESLIVLTFKNINFKTSNNIKSYACYPFLRCYFFKYSIFSYSMEVVPP